MLTDHAGTSEPSHIQICLRHLCSNQGSWQKASVDILVFSIISALPVPYPAPKAVPYPLNPGHTITRNQRHSSHRIRIKLKFQTLFGSFSFEKWPAVLHMQGRHGLCIQDSHALRRCLKTLHGWPSWSHVIGGLFPMWGTGTQRSREEQWQDQHPSGTGDISLGLGAVTRVPATVCLS